MPGGILPDSKIALVFCLDFLGPRTCCTADIDSKRQMCVVNCVIIVILIVIVVIFILLTQYILDMQITQKLKNYLLHISFSSEIDKFIISSFLINDVFCIRDISIVLTSYI